MENQQNEQNKQNYQQGQQVVGQNQQAAPEAPLEKKRRFWKFVLWFLGIIVIVLAAASIVDYLSPEARYARKVQQGQKQYEEMVGEYQEELRRDVYGGKTPEETLKMFIDALRKGDIELASKYFFVDASGDRSKWVDGLSKARDEKRLTEIANLLVNAEKDQTLRTADNSGVWFVVRDNNGNVSYDILLRFNEFAGIWKIESL